MGSLLLVTSCAPSPERSGLGDTDSAVASSVTARWATVDAEPAIDTLTLRGTVVVRATDQVTSPILARIVDLRAKQGDPVQLGDVLAVLQPTTPEIEAFDAAVRDLAAATAAAAGPAAGRPSPAEIDALVGARDRAAAAVRSAESPAPTEIRSTSTGVVVSQDVLLGELVEPGASIASIGPVSSVEVHVLVDASNLDLFLESASRALVVEQAIDGAAQPVLLASEAERVVDRTDSTVTMRMLFVDPPRVTEGQRVDVDVPIEPAPNARSLPVDAVRSFEGGTFVLVEDEGAAGGVRRVDVDIARLGSERVEVVGEIERGTRVLLR